MGVLLGACLLFVVVRFVLQGRRTMRHEKERAAFARRKAILRAALEPGERVQ